MTKRLRADGQRTKPGPKPRIPVFLEGRDYYCGWCFGHRTRSCDECLDGCRACAFTGEIRCQECGGGTIPVPLPDLLLDLAPETPQPPRLSSRGDWRESGAGGLGEGAAEASRLTADSTRES